MGVGFSHQMQIELFYLSSFGYLYVTSILFFSTENKMPCGSPSSVLNVVLLQQDRAQFSHGDEVTYRCSQGSENATRMRTKCLNGEWKPSPLCNGNLLPYFRNMSVMSLTLLQSWFQGLRESIRSLRYYSFSHLN